MLSLLTSVTSTWSLWSHFQASPATECCWQVGTLSTAVAAPDSQWLRMPGSAVTTPPPLQSIPANEWQATVVVGAESVSGPSSSWPSNSGMQQHSSSSAHTLPQIIFCGRAGQRLHWQRPIRGRHRQEETTFGKTNPPSLSFYVTELRCQQG